jgi:diguanylate cyclase (GGDEF)-like protein/PAS domain S-box-containing protein/putative nucleotidyltransferase with HDIG domain
MERALSLEKELFRTTLLSVGDGIISTDNEGKVLVMNRVAENLTGWDAEDARGKEFRHIFNIVNERTRDKAPDPVRQVLDGGEAVELEENCILVSRGGQETPIEDSAAPVRDKDGEISGVVVVFRDCTEKRNRLREIEYLSYHDQLTGLYNRRFFEEELRRLDVPRNLPLSLVMIDVNGLKLFNDAFGHTTGDELLKKVAGVLREECRADDIVARIGGDEFMILLPLTDRDHLDPLMARISDAMSKEQVKDLPISVSLGGATKTDAGKSVEKVFDMAEDQMYRRKISEKSSYHNRSVNLILKTLYSKSPEEKEHSENVSVLSEAIGREMGLAQPEIDELKTAGIIHDIGKIAVSSRILEKDGPLDKEEWEEIRKHPETGYNILSTVSEYSPLAKIILTHHEHWDGKGYPKGLKGDEIPLLSRILGAAEAYDVMVSGRVYRKAMSREDALAELRQCAGTQFDPEVVKIFSGIALSPESGGSSEILKEDRS